MHTLVQSAVEAAKRGDKNKAIEFLEQALRENPNDQDALLALADVMDQPERKRKVIDFDPLFNLLFKLLLFRIPSLSIPKRQPVPHSSFNSLSEAPLVFRYPLFRRIVYSLCAISFFIIFVFKDFHLFSLLMGILFGVATLKNFAKIEVSEMGIQISSLLHHADINWNEIVDTRLDNSRTYLKLISDSGVSVKIPTKIEGYRAIVDVLRHKRPDLFGLTGSVTAFTGARIFKKSFFVHYSAVFLIFTTCTVGGWMVFENLIETAGIWIGLIGLFLTWIFLIGVIEVRLEPDKLTTVSILKRKELTAKEIKEISISDVVFQGRVATFNVIRIQPTKGRLISLSGFPQGDEVIYNILMNWWNMYKNQ